MAARVCGVDPILNVNPLTPREYSRTWLELLSELGKNISIDRDPRVALLTPHPELPVSVSWGGVAELGDKTIHTQRFYLQLSSPSPSPSPPSQQSPIPDPKVTKSENPQNPISWTGADTIITCHTRHTPETIRPNLLFQNLIQLKPWIVIHEEHVCVTVFWSPLSICSNSEGTIVRGLGRIQSWLIHKKITQYEFNSLRFTVKIQKNKLWRPRLLRWRRQMRRALNQSNLAKNHFLTHFWPPDIEHCH